MERIEFMYVGGVIHAQMCDSQTLQKGCPFPGGKPHVPGATCKLNVGVVGVCVCMCMVCVYCV